MAEGRRPPLLLHSPEVTRGLVARLRLTHLLGRFDERLVWASFMLVNGFVTIGILGGGGGDLPDAVRVSVARPHRLPLLLQPLRRRAPPRAMP